MQRFRPSIALGALGALGALALVLAGCSSTITEIAANRAPDVGPPAKRLYVIARLEPFTRAFGEGVAERLHAELDARHVVSEVALIGGLELSLDEVFLRRDAFGPDAVLVLEPYAVTWAGVPNGFVFATLDASVFRGLGDERIWRARISVETSPEESRRAQAGEVLARDLVEALEGSGILPRKLEPVER